jgi:hypothetical protein
MGLVGRLPVFLDDGMGKAPFWGFTIVVMRLPGGLDMEHLSASGQHGTWPTSFGASTRTRTKTVIARTSPASLIEPVEQALQSPMQPGR